MELVDQLFSISNEKQFESIALKVFQWQSSQVGIYSDFLRNLRINPNTIQSTKEIPFLPIEFFKSHTINLGTKIDLQFQSSGTTGLTTSTHFIAEKSIYKQSFLTGFKRFYGDPKDYVFFALLPNYLERNNSSLIYMVKELIEISGRPENSFYLNDFKKLYVDLSSALSSNKKIFLLGVSYALLDFSAQFPIDLKNAIVMETGGMKGTRKEMVREDLHRKLKEAFQVNEIHSEYGMTELLSQAYSKGHGKFSCPPWMQVLIRDPRDPLNNLEEGKIGGLNIIDLANLYSCSFIATQDLGKKEGDTFEILGRFDDSDIRGCNLLAL